MKFIINDSVIKPFKKVDREIVDDLNRGILDLFIADESGTKFVNAFGLYSLKRNLPFIFKDYIFPSVKILVGKRMNIYLNTYVSKVTLDYKEIGNTVVSGIRIIIDISNPYNVSNDTGIKDRNNNVDYRVYSNGYDKYVIRQK